MSGVPPLVLASGSPRRAAVLDILGLAHRVHPADTDERALPGEGPAEHVERLAREKAAAVAERHPGALVLAGDTVVVDGGRIVGKPDDADHAEAVLLALAGREHAVLSGLALAVPGDEGGAAAPAGTVPPRLLSRVDRARVRMRPFGRDEARAYVATGEPMDKAGGYGIQGRGAALVASVEGDYYTVVGLPVGGLLDLLADAGYRYAFPGLRPRADDDPSTERP